MVRQCIKEDFYTIDLSITWFPQW